MQIGWRWCHGYTVYVLHARMNRRERDSEGNLIHLKFDLSAPEPGRTNTSIVRHLPSAKIQCIQYSTCSIKWKPIPCTIPWDLCAAPPPTSPVRSAWARGSAPSWGDPRRRRCRTRSPWRGLGSGGKKSSMYFCLKIARTGINPYRPIYCANKGLFQVW